MSGTFDGVVEYSCLGKDNVAHIFTNNQNSFICLVFVLLYYYLSYSIVSFTLEIGIQVKD